MKLTKIHEGIADESATFDLLNRKPRAAGEWFEITGDQFHYFLELMAPIGFVGASFAMSEFLDGLLTHSFHQIDGRFFCMLIECRWPMKDVGAARGFLADDIKREAVA